jgi:hypothetical protein
MEIRIRIQEVKKYILAKKKIFMKFHELRVSWSLDPSFMRGPRDKCIAFFDQKNMNFNVFK